MVAASPPVPVEMMSEPLRIQTPVASAVAWATPVMLIAPSTDETDVVAPEVRTPYSLPVPAMVMVAAIDPVPVELTVASPRSSTPTKKTPPPGETAADESPVIEMAPTTEVIVVPVSSMITPSSSAVPRMVMVAAVGPVPVELMIDPPCNSTPDSTLVVPVSEMAPLTLVTSDETPVALSRSIPSELAPASAVPTRVIVPVPVERMVDPSR